MGPSFVGELMKGGGLCVGNKELTDGKSEESLLSVHWLEVEAELGGLADVLVNQQSQLKDRPKQY